MLRTLPRRAASYFAEVRTEMEKVAWPTQKMTLLYSAFVVGACIVFALYFGIVDFGLTELVNLLLTR
jgi:preprotein translocase subunit SecE